MGPIFVALVVSLAAAAPTVYDQSEPIYDQENKIDIFLPEALNKQQENRERALRSHYYNYLLYPGLAIASRASMMTGPVFMANYLMEPMTFQDVFEKPVMVVTPSPNDPNTFSVFYLHYGLRSLHRYHAFAWLQDFLKHPGLKGLIFYPQLVYNVRFFETPIISVTVPDDMRMSDFASIHTHTQIPYMFVAPGEIFDRMHFENIAKVSDFKVYKDVIEAYPVNSRPNYEPFFGPQSGHEEHNAPSHPSPSDGTSSFNILPSRSLDYLSQKLVNQGRNVYGEIGYRLANEYPEYDEAFLGVDDGQSNDNYANAQIIAHQQSYQPFAREQVYQNSGSRNLASGISEGQIGANYRFDTEGAVGSHYSNLQTGAISSGNAQNQPLLKSHGEVKYYGGSQGSGFINPGMQVVDEDKASISLGQVGRIIDEQALKTSKEVSMAESPTRSGETQSAGSAPNSLSRVDSGSLNKQVTGSQSSSQQVQNAAGVQREAAESNVRSVPKTVSNAGLERDVTEPKPLATSGTTQQSSQVRQIEGSTRASIDHQGSVTGQIGLLSGQRSDIVLPEGGVTGNVPHFLRSNIDGTTQRVLAHQVQGQEQSLHGHPESSSFGQSTLSSFNFPSSTSAPRSFSAEGVSKPGVVVGNIEPQVMTEVISA